MATKINQRTVSKIETKEISIYSNEKKDFADFLLKYCDDFIDENYDTWEIQVDSLKEIIKDLKKKDPNEIIFGDKYPRTAKEIIKYFTNMIKTNQENQNKLDFPDLVIIDWF